MPAMSVSENSTRRTILNSYGMFGENRIGLGPEKWGPVRERGGDRNKLGDMAVQPAQVLVNIARKAIGDIAEWILDICR